MKPFKILMTGILFFGVIFIMVPTTHAQTCDSSNTNFIDLNGDGFNDNAPDHDGDGIPNGQDPDYIKQAKDGSGQQKGKMSNNGVENMSKFQKRNRFGKTNSSKFQNRANRGTGSQTTGTGTGVCDGSGPRGGSAVCDGSGPNGPSGRGGGRCGK